ncbi:MAG TPA: PKD domain-containing protein [Candidatus Eisenbacteria bacterium]|nr:PKD domain-containing protein [Candidatus Eisenbacteria bacterium]
MRLFQLVVLSLVVLVASATGARAQYMFLDTNGDGANTSADLLAANGAPTTVDVWLRTNAGRDGSPAVCNVDATIPLNINSYVFNLEAVGGQVTYTGFVNQQPQWSTSLGEVNNDGVHYKNGFGSPIFLQPGTYRLATLTITGTNGAPQIRIVDLVPGSADFTSFGTHCYGNDFDNTYKLAGPAGGSDWTDVDGTAGSDPTNSPPVLAPIGNKTGLPGSLLSFQATATDADLPAQSLTFSLGQSTPPGATIHPTTGQFSWTLPSEFGSHTVTIIVTDNGTPAMSDFQSFLVTVLSENDPPVLNPIGNKTANELSLLEFVATATDPSQSGLTWTLGPGAPAGATIRPGNGRFEWYVAEQQAPGVYPITVIVTTNSTGLSDSETFTITANEVNVPPHFNGGTEPLTVMEGQTATRQVSAFDADVPVQTLAFFKQSGPAFALVSVSGLVTVSPGFSDSGTYPLRIRVFDGVVFGFDNIIDITVLNAPLVADAGGPYEGIVGVPVTFDGTGSSDPDGNPLGYLWSFGDGTQGSGAMPIHTYQGAAVYSVTLTVTAGPETDSDATTATILPELDMLVFTTGGNKVINLGSGKPQVCVQMEPLGNAFDILDVDPASVRMAYGGASVPALSGKTSVGTDKNQNGVDEMTACFSKDDLRTLFAGLPGGEQTVTVLLQGTHVSGAPVEGPLTIRVKAGGGPNLAVSPNPLNPSATAMFHTSRAGSVRVTLYDLHGRLVRTLMNESSVAAGYHDVTIDGHDANGGRLASGIYYVKVRSTDGEVTKAITILK